MALVNPMPSLGALLDGIHSVPARLDRAFGDLRLDHRDVVVDDVFLALSGARFKATRFIDPALEAGAMAVLSEAESSHPNVLWVPGLRRELPRLAERRYGAQSALAPLIGVTGTNGKTTVAWLCSAALNALGRRAAYVGTLGSGLVGEAGMPDARPTRNTTPELITVRQRLWTLRADAACLEMSSHALAQGRLAELATDVAVITNIGRDHLDYHGTEAAYIAAKFAILSQPRLRAAVLNIDDPRVAQGLHVIPKDLVTYGFGRGPQGPVPTRHWVQCVEAEADLGGTRLRLRSDAGPEVEIHSRLIGGFHIENLTAAFTALWAAGFAPAEAAEALSCAPPVPGRFEPVTVADARRGVVPSSSQAVRKGPAQDAFAGEAASPLRVDKKLQTHRSLAREAALELPEVIVDYAHTPDGLEKLLEAVRAQYAGPIVLVMGCGGDRDQGKRAPMGRVAAEGADLVVVTSDNPRSEPQADIAAQILAGVDLVAEHNAAAIKTILDRGQAIECAIQWAVEWAAGPPVGNPVGAACEGDVVWPRKTLRRIAAANNGGAASAQAHDKAHKEAHKEVHDEAQKIANEAGCAPLMPVVVIAGKGHETTQEIAGTLIPFSDRDCAAAVLAACLTDKACADRARTGEASA